MNTYFSISLNATASPDDWLTLKNIVVELTNSITFIINACRRPLHLSSRSYIFSEDDGEKIEAVCKAYSEGSLVVDEAHQIIYIIISGTDDLKDIQEHVARIFCWLVLDQIINKGISLNINME